MVKIVIKNIQHSTLTSNDPDRSILNVIHDNHIDWMHACGAKGRCTTCKMVVVKGIDNISAPSEFEMKVIAAGKLRSNERLACQARLVKDYIEIEVPKETQLPHISYD